MANVGGQFYSGSKGRSGTTPESPSDLEGVQPFPVNPPGSNGGNAGVGILLNNKVIGGVKRFIESSNLLFIPLYWQYNIHGYTLDVSGSIDNNGEINIG
jgi:hypothetical protein